jgi:hypothetical protein
MKNEHILKEYVIHVVPLLQSFKKIERRDSIRKKSILAIGDNHGKNSKSVLTL